MRGLIGEHDIETVWFGAAAPLALLAAAGPQRRSPAGAGQHPRPRGGLVDAAGARARRCAASATTPTSSPSSVDYTRGRFASAFGPRAAPGASAAGRRHRPLPARRRRPARELRARYGLGERPTVVCVSRLVPRKGQDMLIKALPDIRRRVDGAALVIVGGGPYGEHLHRLAARGRRRRARGVHRRSARRRTACPLRDGRRVRDALPHPGLRAGRRGPGHRVPGGLGDAACRWWPATPAAPRRPSATARPGGWSTAVRTTRSSTRSARSSPTPSGGADGCGRAQLDQPGLVLAGSDRAAVRARVCVTMSG